MRQEVTHPGCMCRGAATAGAAHLAPGARLQRHKLHLAIGRAGDGDRLHTDSQGTGHACVHSCQLSESRLGSWTCHQHRRSLPSGAGAQEIACLLSGIPIAQKSSGGSHLPVILRPGRHAGVHHDVGAEAAHGQLLRQARVQVRQRGLRGPPCRVSLGIVRRSPCKRALFSLTAPRRQAHSQVGMPAAYKIEGVAPGKAQGVNCELTLRCLHSEIVSVLHLRVS